MRNGFNSEVESNSTTTSETLTLITPRRSILLTIAGCGACLALGLWFIIQSEDAILVAWSSLGIVLLAIGLVFGALQLRSPVRLILTREGFTLTGRLGVSVPWHEIEQFLVYAEEEDIDGLGGVLPHASWRLKEAAPSATGMVSKLNRMGGLPVDGSLPRNIGMTPEALTGLMEEWRQRHTLSSY